MKLTKIHTAIAGAVLAMGLCGTSAFVGAQAAEKPEPARFAVINLANIYESLDEEKAWQEETFPADDTVQSYDRQVEHFIECINTNSESRNDLVDGWQTLKVIQAAFKSNADGKVTAVEKVS